MKTLIKIIPGILGALLCFFLGFAFYSLAIQSNSNPMTGYAYCGLFFFFGLTVLFVTIESVLH